MHSFSLTPMSLAAFEEDIFKIGYEVHKRMLESKTIHVIESINILGESTLYHHLQLFEKALLATFKLETPDILYEHIVWRYSFYINKGIDMRYFLEEFKIYTIVCKQYLYKSSAYEIVEVFRELSANHITFLDNANQKVLVSEEGLIYALRSALLDGNRSEVIELITLHIDKYKSFEDLFDHTLKVAMHEVGSLWEKGEIPVAKEHLATVTIQEVITHYAMQANADKKKGKALVTSAGVEMHTVPLGAIKSLLEKLGYEAVVFQPSSDIDVLYKAILEFHPDIVVFSQTIPSTLIDLKSLLVDIKNSGATLNPKIIVGGQAFLGNITNFQSLYHFQADSLKLLEEYVESL